jgi:protein-disulfide isomerase
MKLISPILFLIVFSIAIAAQSPSQILATADGRSFTADDLDPNVKKVWDSYPSQVIRARRSFLEQLISDLLIKLEARERKTTSEKLIDREVVKKIPDPTNEKIKAVYDANKNAIGDKTLEEIRPQIISFLRRQPEQDLWRDFVGKLKTKYKVSPGKDINSSNLKNEDVLAKVGETEITLADFDKKYGLQLYEFEANVYEQAIESLESAIDSALILAEAKNLEISSSEYIAREVTSKMKDFSPQEEEKLQKDLREKLYRKYKAGIYIKTPKPFIQNVSSDDDPFQGKQDAPVTVIMFTDFQCPACAAAHPVVKKVVAEYGDQVKFVVRDFPLTQIHENAFNAARAANAANKQGKFFEYAELLYDNQISLEVESLKKYAEMAGLDKNKFEKDFADAKFADEIRKDMLDGESYSVNSTPSIFVNGYKIRNLSAANLRKAIERALRN